MSLFLSYLLILSLELLLLPTGKLIQKIDKELSRKWGHLLSGTILWFGALSFDNLIHQVVVTSLFMVFGALCSKLNLIAEERDDESLNNKKATFLYGLGHVIMALVVLNNPKYLLHYGLTTFTLAFGDAFAALVGVRFGKYSIKLPHNKSLIGTLAFITSAVLGMLIPCIILGYGLSLLPKLIVLAIIGSIVEIYSGDWDNLLIQIIIGFIAVIII